MDTILNVQSVQSTIDHNMDDNIPSAFRCPITLDVMLDPVIFGSSRCATGRSYERIAIEEWLQKNNTDPLTNKSVPLREQFITPNIALRCAIEDYMQIICGKTLPYSAISVKERVKFASDKDIHQGIFGNETVAILKFKNIDILENEAKILVHLGYHAHIVNFLGRISLSGSENVPQNGIPNTLVTEWAPFGDLISHVRRLSSEKSTNEEGSIFSLSTYHCLMIAEQVADGMVMCHAKSILHRQLSARHILVYSFDHDNPLTTLVKIGDFGSAILLPKTGNCILREKVRTCKCHYWAPECIQSFTWYRESDVWSFGFLLWEIFSNFMNIPYNEIITENKDIATKVYDGILPMTRPDTCPEEVWKLIESCWCLKHNDRPTFLTIYKSLQNLRIQYAVNLLLEKAKEKDVFHESSSSSSSTSNDIGSKRLNNNLTEEPAIKRKKECLELRNYTMKKIYDNGEVYEGEFCDDLRHGTGTMTYANGDIYHGEWIADLRVGYGKISFESRIVKSFEGQWCQDVHSAAGKYTLTDGKIFEGEWSTDGVTNGRMTYTNGDIYEGYFECGLRCGKGLMIYINTETYNGDWCLDEKQGEGIHKFQNGDIYEGHWQANIMNGIGKMIYASGAEYKGNWLDSQRHGYGCFHDSDTTIYEGEWRLDSKEGYGTWRHPSGQSYVGLWHRGLMTGHGTFLFPPDDVREQYRGDWLDGEATGRGILTYKNKDIYDGEFLSNKRHGKGEMNCSDRKVINGHWLNDLLVGFVKVIYSNNDIYKGNFVNNKRHGKGKIKYYNENCISLYDGEWEDDLKHGTGVLTLGNGYVLYGLWQLDKMINSGRIVYTNGDVYEGQWTYEMEKQRLDVIHNIYKNGVGKYIYKNGDIYEGHFVNDSMNGKGKFKYISGVVYNGEWMNSLRHGRGSCTYVRNDIATRREVFNNGNSIYTYKLVSFNEEGGSYTGDWEYDKRHGKGIVSYSNGDVYDGHWKEDLRSGEGHWRSVHGDEYTGTFVKNEISGAGTIIFCNGSSYTGQVQLGLMHGHGKFIDLFGDMYEGDFRFGVRHGTGLCRYNSSENGGLYIGQFDSGVRSGSGKFTSCSGCVYDGIWRDDMREGHGVLRNASNALLYEGDWSRDKRYGFGKYIFPNGSVYEGSWKAGARCGRGKFTALDGNVFDGEWRNDLRHGKGSITTASGETVSGIWLYDRRVEELDCYDQLNGLNHGPTTSQLAVANVSETLHTKATSMVGEPSDDSANASVPTLSKTHLNKSKLAASSHPTGNILEKTLENTYTTTQSLTSLSDKASSTHIGNTDQFSYNNTDTDLRASPFPPALTSTPTERIISTSFSHNHLNLFSASNGVFDVGITSVTGQTKYDDVDMEIDSSPVKPSLTGATAGPPRPPPPPPPFPPLISSASLQQQQGQRQLYTATSGSGSTSSYVTDSVDSDLSNVAAEASGWSAIPNTSTAPLSNTSRLSFKTHQINSKKRYSKFGSITPSQRSMSSDNHSVSEPSIPTLDATQSQSSLLSSQYPSRQVLDHLYSSQSKQSSSLSSRTKNTTIASSIQLLPRPLQQQQLNQQTNQSKHEYQQSKIHSNESTIQSDQSKQTSQPVVMSKQQCDSIGPLHSRLSTVPPPDALQEQRLLQQLAQEKRQRLSCQSQAMPSLVLDTASESSSLQGTLQTQANYTSTSAPSATTTSVVKLSSIVPLLSSNTDGSERFMTSSNSNGVTATSSGSCTSSIPSYPTTTSSDSTVGLIMNPTTTPGIASATVFPTSSSCHYKSNSYRVETAGTELQEAIQNGDAMMARLMSKFKR